MRETTSKSVPAKRMALVATSKPGNPTQAGQPHASRDTPCKPGDLQMPVDLQAVGAVTFRSEPGNHLKIRACKSG